MTTSQSVTRSRYVYRSLSSPKDIRLLILRPGCRVDDIQFSLVHASLDSETQYEAISYAWGDPSLTKPVYCSDRPMRVTVSLFTALRHLRYEDRIRTLWADAVCIDQENLPEKEQQVRIMPYIYSRAEKVLIWLGDDVNGLHGLQDTLNDGMNIIDTLIAQSQRDGINFLKRAAEKTQSLMMQGKTSLFTLNWTPIIQLIRNRSWFRRKWVLQEVILAKNAIVHCGDITVLWEHLAFLITLGIRSGSLSGARQDDAKFEEGIRNFQIVAQFQLGLKAGGNLTLVKAICWTRNFLCSDPRDHLFAVLSLASKVEQREYSIQPDYNQHYSGVFTKFALLAISKQHDLTVLSMAGLTEEMDSTLPSWVPNLSRQGDDGMLAGRESYNTGGHNYLGIQISEDGKILQCRGKIIDSVQILAPCKDEVALPSRQYHGSKARISQWLEWFRMCKVMASKATSGTNNNQYEALAKCLVCELDGEGERKRSGFSASILRYEHNCENVLSDSLALDSEALSGTGLQATVELESALTVYGQPRRFFLGSSGRLGMLPRLAQQDDQICIIFGSEVPYVIRSTGRDSYQLVGECYVHGVMDGECLIMEEYEELIFNIE